MGRSYSFFAKVELPPEVLDRGGLELGGQSALESRQQSTDIRGRAQQVSRFGQAFELVLGDQSYVLGAPALDDVRLPGLCDLVTDLGQMGPSLGVGRAFRHPIFLYRDTVQENPKNLKVDREPRLN